MDYSPTTPALISFLLSLLICRCSSADEAETFRMIRLWGSFHASPVAALNSQNHQALSNQQQCLKQPHFDSASVELWWKQGGFECHDRAPPYNLCKYRLLTVLADLKATYFLVWSIIPVKGTALLSEALPPPRGQKRHCIRQPFNFSQ